MALMARLDTQDAIAFVDLMTAGASCPLDRQIMLDRLHARENGQLLSGAAAFAAMWRAIPLLRPLGVAARQPWILKRLEQAYLLFLRLRPRLQKFAGAKAKTGSPDRIKKAFGTFPGPQLRSPAHPGSRLNMTD